LLRQKGTLPESVTESDLETLNAGLRFLFAHLRDSRQQSKNESDGGRSAAATALGGMWRFIMLFEEALAESLQLPLLRLHGALGELEANLVDPMLRPVPRRGHPPSSHVHEAVIGRAVAAVRLLMRRDFRRMEACEAVAAQLRKDGVRPERGSADGVAADTVRHWCADVDSDVGRHGLAAQLCHSVLSETEGSDLSASSRDEVRSRELARLSAWVREITLPIQKPANPPV